MAHHSSLARASPGNDRNASLPDARQWPFDPLTSTLDLRHLRSTDLPCNAFVHVPLPLEENEEIKVQDLKRELLQVTEDYILESDENRRKKGSNKIYANLTLTESEGLDKVRRRNDVVVFQTDKSGRFAVDTCENYIEATAPHVEGDAVVSDKEHDTLQREINAHTAMWLRFCRAGELTGSGTTGDYQRIKSSMKVHNHGYAPLYTLRKDHKPFEDPVAGPPTRPVCGGAAAYNSKMSHLLGLFLRPVWMEQETACSSTEEMLAAFHEVNESGVLDQHCVIGSLDVKALYPSLDVPFVSRVVADMFLSSNVSVPCVNTKELGLYLALNRTPSELRDLGLTDFCPRRRSKKGPRPVITGCAAKEQEEKRFAPWEEARRSDPDERTKKKMLAEALCIGVEFVMSNHLYMFNQVARKQSKGGPIGLALTGDVAQVFMCFYDRELIKKMEGLGLDVLLYRRYVDDVNFIVRKMRALEYVEPLRALDAIIVTDIGQEADTIHHSIQVTVDCPSFHEDKKLPILDLKVLLQGGSNQGSSEQEISRPHRYQEDHPYSGGSKNPA